MKSPFFKPGYSIPRPAAFTLIELLAVVAIVGILVAILVPAIFSVRDRALAATNTSNLRTITQAAMLWSQDHNGAVVPSYDPSDGWAHSFRNWTGLLAPYLGWNKENTEFQGVDEMPVYVNPKYPDRWGYGHNYVGLRFVNRNANGRYYNPDFMKYSRVEDPARTVFFTTSRMKNSEDRKFPNNWRPFVRPVYGTLDDFAVDFSGPGNTAVVLWLDGHVTTETKESLDDPDLWVTDGWTNSLN